MITQILNHLQSEGPSRPHLLDGSPSGAEAVWPTPLMGERADGGTNNEQGNYRNRISHRYICFVFATASLDHWLICSLFCHILLFFSLFLYFYIRFWLRLEAAGGRCWCLCQNTAQCKTKKQKCDLTEIWSFFKIDLGCSIELAHSPNWTEFVNFTPRSKLWPVHWNSQVRKIFKGNLAGKIPGKELNLSASHNLGK